MSKMIDISAKLTNDRPKIKLSDDLIFEVDDRKNTLLKIDQKMNGEDVDSVSAIDDILEALLGEKALKEINKLDLSFGATQTIMTAAMAAVTGEDFNVAEARFQEAKQEEATE